MPSVWKSGASGCGSNCSSIYFTARLYLPFPRCCVYFSSTKGIFNLPSATVECKLSSNISNQMKVIVFITDYPVVDRIIRHLKLSFLLTTSFSLGYVYSGMPEDENHGKS